MMASHTHNLREMVSAVNVVGALLVILLASKLWRAFVYLVWRPYVITKRFEKQGLKGPPCNLIKGSLPEIRSMYKDAKEITMDVASHDITPKVLPHFHKWSSQYGRKLYFWMGSEVRVLIMEPEQVRQLLSNNYPKSKAGPILMALMGKGLVFTEGSDWARHRRVVSPAFNTDRLKMMSKCISDCTLSMLRGWQENFNEDELQEREIEMAEQVKELTANVISHTAFGSSYTRGKQVFLAQQELIIMAQAAMYALPIPGLQYLPTKRNLRSWKLKKRIKSMLTLMIRSRLDSKDSGYGDDLLGLMLEACEADSEGPKLSMDEIIDECKTFFFTGHETTSHFLTWAIFLLSTNLEWQERLREEVFKECGRGIPSVDMLNKLKKMHMVLLETLRLYCPVTHMTRKASKEMNLGELRIPKGTTLVIPIMMIHRDAEYWGEDANAFNPLRFENGVSRAAKHPNSLIPFSIGPRACVGQNFTMLEAKMVLSLILQRFSFTLSSGYRHEPTSLLTLQPQFGLPIVLRSVHV